MNLKALFNELYGGEPLLVRSPGRVNIIGEHTDYNEGFVLPAAIDKDAYVAIGARSDRDIHLFASDLSTHFSISLDALTRQTKPSWPNYILGVVAQFAKLGPLPGGFNLVLTSDVPIGAGLSSSAAVECAVAFALNELWQTGLDRMTLVKMAQKAEHEYAGVLCGIMDQFASMFGKKDHCVRLDCRSLDFEHFPLHLPGIKIVLFDTHVKHSLASSEYNDRRAECEKGVEFVQQKYTGVKSLRDCDLPMLQESLDTNSLTYRRCKYVVEENQRVTRVCQALEKGDILTAGKIMFQTHDGLSQDYSVSCRELDFLVNQVRQEPAVLGARMMGGGFGGCTINLVREEGLENLVAKLEKAYQLETGKDMGVYIADIADGTSRVN